MEQRAPGHAVLDDKIYRRGLTEMKGEIAVTLAGLDDMDPETPGRRDALRSMEIACDATIRFAERHAELAERMAGTESDPDRRRELLRIAEVCRRVPVHAPRDFHEALQAYWFCHLGVVTELNGWDAFSPGHLDQHLGPFFQRGLDDGSLTRESARELLETLFIKFNNHPAPPKVGVTAAESGTYTDFALINVGGVKPDGSDAVNELSYLILDLPFARTPDLLIRREGVFDRLAGVLGFDDIDFESEEFSRAFYVKSSDKKFAYDVVHPRMMEWLLAKEVPMIDIEQGRCCVAQDRVRWEPQEFKRWLRRMDEFFDQWPDYLTSQLGD